MAINGTLIEEDEDNDENEDDEHLREFRENIGQDRVELDEADHIHARHQSSDNPKMLTENFYENQTTNTQTMDMEQRLELLRNLLTSERRINLQRRRNNQAMQQYLRQLQADYLRSQRDLLEALQLGRRIKAQKEAQLAALSSTVDEKDRLIGQLRLNLENLDETKVRDEFRELLDKQKQLAEVEQEQLRKQLETIQQQLVGERVNNSQILQQFQAKLDQQLVLHKKESENLCEQVVDLESKLKQLLEEPKEIIIKNLKDENNKLSCQLEEADVKSEESSKRYELLKKRLENLMIEQEQVEHRHEEELERLQMEQAEQRASLTEFKLRLEDKEELIQILQFNLNRSEKRSKSLLTTLKGKEDAYKELIGAMGIKHEEESKYSSVRLRALETKLVELETELDRRRNELIKLELEHENQLESIRIDRDQRVHKLAQERQKADRELQAAEIKLAHEIEERETKCRQVEQLQKEVNQFREESKRLSIELTKSEAKLFGKQKELNEAIKSNRQCLLNPTRPLSAIKTNRIVRCHPNQIKRNKINNIYTDDLCKAMI